MSVKAEWYRSVWVTTAEDLGLENLKKNTSQTMTSKSSTFKKLS